MKYYINKIVELNFDTAIDKAIEELKKEGFGVLTEINVQETLKKKIDVDFMKYRILGACNPVYAHKALSLEDKIGVMLPCNIIVQEHDNGNVEVSAVNPKASMMAIENPKLESIANEIEIKLNRVVEAI
jgi:uncharacterized protein (DUF302 family)